MTDPIARAVSTIAVAGAAAGIAFASPGYAPLAVMGLIGGIYFVWESA